MKAACVITTDMTDAAESMNVEMIRLFCSCFNHKMLVLDHIWENWNWVGGTLDKEKQDEKDYEPLT